MHSKILISMMAVIYKVFFLALFFSAPVAAKIFIDFAPDMHGDVLVEGDSRHKNYQDWTVADTVVLNLLNNPKKPVRCVLILSKKKAIDSTTLALLRGANRNSPVSFVAEYVNTDKQFASTQAHPYARMEASYWFLQAVESKQDNAAKTQEVLKLRPSAESVLKLTTWEFDGVNYVISGQETLNCYGTE